MDDSKLVEQIAKLYKEIDKQKKYCEEYVIPVLHELVKTRVHSNTLYPWWENYKYERLKISFYGYFVGKRNRNTRIDIVLKYKYKTVFKGHCKSDAECIYIDEFHACEWIGKLSGLCEYAPAKIKMKADERKRKLLEKALESVTAKCNLTKSFCESEE